ncbi:Uracil phosphoribosyltransferase [Mycena indigotica]|uniref:Ribosomal RNA-processing protein 8 n=1 Tax=Mycena indigotica TaxID=2126181 RepID=A0A8H6W0V8_9AGAR|nr:Uracil phosphoribosyltransferase [Mycena indigotica]KAF7301394.1 Uracil phosphoribosyltransferase [Mycena indigotica]
MPLAFEVPGWSVPSSPMGGPGPSNSKKRKRPTNESTESIDIQKFVQQHVDADNASTTSRVKALGKSLVKNTIERKRQKQAEKLEAKKKTISRPKALMPTEKGQKSRPPSSSSTATNTRPTKRPKRAHDEEPNEKALPSIPEESPRLTTLQQDMRKSLDGAKFRIINETLYKSESKEAYDMMQNDPKVFEEYHRGFRHQVESWPTNPVEHYISVLSQYPSKTTIADLGCGDAAMARALTPQGLNVLSFDLVSDGTYVVEADICSRIPLPGSEPPLGEKTSGDGQVVDVVVCALSLMGTNWTGCVREAWRILRPDGELKIAEVASRFTDIEDFIGVVSSVGFKLKSKNEANTHFTLFEFKKIERAGKREKEWSDVLRRGGVLKPCEYKRR